MELLEMKDLTVEYVTDGETVHAVNGIRLSLGKGETLGLVGETGAGKSTTALSVLGLLPKYISRVPQGEIRFKGKDLLHCGEKEMRKIRGNQISMIFQDPMTSLNPTMTVGEQIQEVLDLHKDDLGSDGANDVGTILEMVGIPGSRQNEYPHQFSGGMKQRVMIAIALACQPDLLIADEPTTALDVTIQAQILNLMRDLIEKKGTSVLLITHDLGVVATICDSVAIMYAGEIVEYGTLEHIFDPANPHHPYTVGLFDSIPSIDTESERLKPIHGLMPDPSRLPEGCKFHPRCPHCKEGVCTQGPVHVFEQNGHMIMCHLMNQTEGNRYEQSTAGM